MGQSCSTSFRTCCNSVTVLPARVPSGSRGTPSVTATVKPPTVKTPSPAPAGDAASVTSMMRCSAALSANSEVSHARWMASVRRVAAGQASLLG